MEDMKIYNAIVGAKMAATIAGTDNYNQLSNQPKINSVTLTGNKSSSDLGLQSTIDSSHKLDPANVSFSEDQTSALSSGIDSTKVNQILANKNMLAAIIDTCGGKNKLTTNNADIAEIPVNAPYALFNLSEILTPPFKLSIDKVTTNDTDAEVSKIITVNSGGTTINAYDCERGVKNTLTINDAGVAAIKVQPSDNWSHSGGKSLKVENAMVCTMDMWNISDKYVDYCPSFAEYYASLNT